MKFSAKTLCISGTAAFLTSGTAFAQEACKTYVVQRGDTLSEIARTAYGDDDLYPVIYSANRQTVGPLADLIETGIELDIPCTPDEAEVAAAAAPSSTGLIIGVFDPADEPTIILPPIPFADPVPSESSDSAEEAPAVAAEPPAVADTTATAPAQAPETTEVAVAAPEPEVPAPAEEPPAPEVTAEVPEAPAPAPVEQPQATEVAAAAPEPAAPAEGASTVAPYRFVTGNGYAPFTDEMLPGGGLFTQLVEMAVFRADPSTPYSMAFVNDWEAHVDALLPSGAYDISFPWPRPDCESTTMLAAEDQARCEAFVFSVPLYEVVDAFFASSTSELLSATDYAAFQGKRICRPEGFTTGVLDAAGLSGNSIQLIRPVSATDCFEALAAGQVDLVSIDAAVGDSVVAALNLTGGVAQNQHLMAFDSLHVIAHKSNPRAVGLIEKLNSGVAEMYQSGEWFDIISAALEPKAPQE